MCISCSQACMAGVGNPSAPCAVTVLAYGRPVFSKMGRASMSARSRIFFPGPFLKMPARPWPPMLVWMVKPPRAARCSAQVLEVASSWLESSGFEWKYLYRASYRVRSTDAEARSCEIGGAAILFVTVGCGRTIGRGVCTNAVCS